MNLGFIGTGTIASSVITGIFKSKISFKKIYISGTYNVSQMLKQVPLQQSSWLICDPDLYALKAPEGFAENTKGIKNVVVRGQAGQTDLFSHAHAQAHDLH